VGVIVHVSVNICVHEHVVWRANVISTGVHDALVDGVVRSDGEQCLGAARTALPLHAIKVLPVLCTERVILEEGLGENFDNESDDLPSQLNELKSDPKVRTHCR
jgi:hypothetical protein